MAFPELEPTDLADDSRLHAKVDRLLLGDRQYEKLTQAILDAQAILQRESSDEGWLAFLTTEEAGSLRSTFCTLRTVRWAFEAGVIHGSKN